MLLREGGVPRNNWNHDAQLRNQNMHDSRIGREKVTVEATVSAVFISRQRRPMKTEEIPNKWVCQLKKNLAPNPPVNPRLDMAPIS